MSLVDSPTRLRVSALPLDELEDAFAAWGQDPVKPDVVEVVGHGDVPLVELLRHLGASMAVIAPAAGQQLGLPPGMTVATAAAALLHATVRSDGPRCRSFRAASYYLRGLSHLGADPLTTIGPRVARTNVSTGRHDVR